jgi:hypothetical protein
MLLKLRARRYISLEGVAWVVAFTVFGRRSYYPSIHNGSQLPSGPRAVKKSSDIDPKRECSTSLANKIIPGNFHLLFRYIQHQSSTNTNTLKFQTRDVSRRCSSLSSCVSSKAAHLVSTFHDMVSKNGDCSLRPALAGIKIS